MYYAFETLKYNLIDNKTDPHFQWPKWLPIKNWEIDTLLENYSFQLSNLRNKIDLVAGGPPCQGFSMAGRRKEDDVRNHLVHSYIKFIELVHPKMLFFENVKGFTQEFKKNKEKGIAYSHLVVEELEKLGYRTASQLVNFGDYGVPQKRTRFILVGLSESFFGASAKCKAELFFTQLQNARFDFLKAKGLRTGTTLSEAISDLLMSKGIVIDNEYTHFRFGKYNSIPLTAYQKFMRSNVNIKGPHPDSHRFANHNNNIIQRFQLLLDLTKKRRCSNIDNEIKRHFHINKHTIIPLDGNQKAPTITTLPDDYIHYCEPRILTVREYARIQSFPDDFIFKGKYTTGGKLRTKETPRYTQIGNAIPPLFGEQAGCILDKIINNRL